jgi:hypothetical protein
MKEKIMEIIERMKSVEISAKELHAQYGVQLCGVDNLGKSLHVFCGIRDVAKEFGQPLSVKPFIEANGSSQAFFVSDGTEFFQISELRDVQMPQE